MASFCGYLSVFIPICLQWLAWVVTANQKNIPVWTWLDGSMLINQSSVMTLHTMGKQYPGSRADSAVWTDTNTGVMWMFGGRVGSSGSLPALNELWRYSMLSQDWTNIAHDREHQWPQSRYAAAVCGMPGSFFVLHGGAESAENLLSDTWLYHLHNESWTLLQESSNPGAQSNRLHWCTRNALWLLSIKETTIDSNKSLTMWRYSLVNYKWEKVSANFGDVLSRQNLGQKLGLTTWVVNDTELYLLGARPSDIGHNDDERCQGKKQECALWRFSTISNKWRRVSVNTNKRGEEVVDSDLIEFNAVPGCPAKGASWQDTDSNLWLQDTDTCEKKQHARSDLWMFDLRHSRWEHFKSLTSPQYQLGYEIVEGTSDIRNHPAQRAYCASWSWNNTYYLFGGLLARNGSNGALNDLWSFQLIDAESLKGRPTSTLAISPVGVFFLSLGALCFLALFVFSVIFFSKCSTGPRLKPPNHFGDKIRYSPVETDEVFIT